MNGVTSLEHKVTYNRVRHAGSVVPLAVLVLQLQPTDVVLQQERKETVVSVLACAYL